MARADRAVPRVDGDRTVAVRRVVVLVGTDHHPFDRLIGWVDGWAAGQPDVDILVQYGTSAPPTHARGVAYLDHASVLAELGRAHVVVSHGGPSTIVEAQRRGRVPIVVPRNPELGEHVDGHQQRFAAAMGAKGLVRLAADPSALARLLDDDLSKDRPPTPSAPLPPADLAAAALGRVVDDLLARGPTRRMRWRRLRCPDRDDGPPASPAQH